MFHVERPKPPYLEPTVDTPIMEELEEMMFDDVVEATDGCQVEPDGWCEHGHVSWLVYLGFVKGGRHMLRFSQLEVGDVVRMDVIGQHMKTSRLVTVGHVELHDPKHAYDYVIGESELRPTVMVSHAQEVIILTAKTHGSYVFSNPHMPELTYRLYA